MTLSPGSKIGSFEVVGLLGVGGMGEVYRAKDSKLNRSVALKVLPESLTHDAQRVARFRREAQVLASINHPNIGAIHGLEDGSDITALVLELVEGPTLADRLASGPVPVAEALPIAAQIASALEAAHDLGIVHRDLKPANIKLRPDGTVKVLDFGLAKATERADEQGDLTHSPTVVSPATQAGILLGTAAYMSPEQARGQVVDKRTDIWAFGCVLFEMLTGSLAFAGPNVTDVLASVLRATPNWSALPADATPLLPVLQRCLEKDVKQRLRDAGDVQLAIIGRARRRVARSGSNRRRFEALVESRLRSGAGAGRRGCGRDPLSVFTERAGSDVAEAIRIEIVSGVAARKFACSGRTLPSLQMARASCIAPRAAVFPNLSCSGSISWMP